MSDFKEQIDELVYTLEGIGEDELCRSDSQAVRKAIDLIKAIRDLGPDLVSMTEEDFESTLLDIIVD